MWWCHWSRKAVCWCCMLWVLWVFPGDAVAASPTWGSKRGYWTMEQECINMTVHLFILSKSISLSLQHHSQQLRKSLPRKKHAHCWKAVCSLNKPWKSIEDHCSIWGSYFKYGGEGLQIFWVRFGGLSGRVRGVVWCLVGGMHMGACQVNIDFYIDVFFCLVCLILRFFLAQIL